MAVVKSGCFRNWFYAKDPASKAGSAKLSVAFLKSNIVKASLFKLFVYTCSPTICLVGHQVMLASIQLLFAGLRNDSCSHQLQVVAGWIFFLGLMKLSVRCLLRYHLICAHICSMLPNQHCAFAGHCAFVQHD
jgi:hypothetical protein